MSPNKPEPRRSGGLPPLVLVHGWGGSFAATWSGCGWLEAAAASGRTVTGIDLPGHGTAPASRDPAAYGDLAGALEHRLPAGRLDAVGFSLGGKLRIALAIRAPGRVRRLVLGGLGSNIVAPEAAGAALAQELEEGVGSATAAAVAALVAYAEAGGSDPLAVAAVLRRAANPVIEPARLALLDVPILVVNGEDDAIALPDADFVAALPNARAVRLPGVDHLGLPLAPTFQRLALGFVNRRDL